jgi:hypothetical protein
MKLLLLEKGDKDIIKELNEDAEERKEKGKGKRKMKREKE